MRESGAKIIGWLFLVVFTTLFGCALWCEEAESSAQRELMNNTAPAPLAAQIFQRYGGRDDDAVAVARSSAVGAGHERLPGSRVFN
jgi:hypothetical protein